MKKICFLFILIFCLIVNNAFAQTAADTLIIKHRKFVESLTEEEVGIYLYMIRQLCPSVSVSSSGKCELDWSTKSTIDDIKRDVRSMKRTIDSIQSGYYEVKCK